MQVLSWEGVISSTDTWWDKHMVQWEGRSGPRSPNVCSRLCEPNRMLTPLATLLCFSIFKINCREKTKEEEAQRGQRGRDTELGCGVGGQLPHHCVWTHKTPGKANGL